MTISKKVTRSAIYTGIVAVFLVLVFAGKALAYGGLTGALEDVTKKIQGNDTPADNSAVSAQSPQQAEPIQSVVPIESAKKEDGETTVDPQTGIATTVKTHSDGSQTVTKKDKDGRLISEEIFQAGQDKPEVVKTVDLATGNTTTQVFGKDGTKSTVVTNSEGFLVSEEYTKPEAPQASLYDPDTGVTTSSVKNPDGSRTVTKKDKTGHVVSEEKMPAPGSGEAFASAYDLKTGATTTARRNADGSHIVTQSKENVLVGGGSAGAVTPGPVRGTGSSGAQLVQNEKPAPGFSQGAVSPVTGQANPVPTAAQRETPGMAAASGESVLDEIESGQAHDAAVRAQTPGQAGRGVAQAAREGRVEANPAEWERNAAAGLGGAFGADSPEEAAALAARNRQHQDDMTQPRRDAQASADIQRRFEESRVRAEEAARQERTANADRRSLQTRRHLAEEDLRRYEDSLDHKLKAEGRTHLNEEEFFEQQRREARMLELMQLTPEESAVVERNETVRQQVNDTLNRNAQNYGLRSPEEVAERKQNERMSDAATRNWRDYTFTGRMTSEVRNDMFNQREQGIVNNSQVIAAQNYLRKSDLTGEQRKAAEQYLAQAVMQRGHNAEAILLDGAVVGLGVAADVGTLAAGGTISRGVSRIMGTEAAAMGAQGGRAAVPRSVAPGQLPQAVAEGTTIIERGGTRAAAQGAEEAGTVIERGAASRAGKPFSEMTRAEQQAYNDALAKRAVSARPNLNESQVVGSDVLPPPAGQVTEAAAGQLSRNLSQAQIDDLFRAGQNLTREQLMQKTDLILSGRVHPAYRPAVAPGTVPQAAADATTRLFPGRAAVPEAAAASFRSAETEIIAPTGSQLSEAGGSTILSPGRSVADVNPGGTTILNNPLGKRGAVSGGTERTTGGTTTE